MAVFAGVMLLTIIVASRSRIGYAQRILQAQSRGAFDDLRTPAARSGQRWKALLALCGMLGVVISFVILMLQIYMGLRLDPPWIGPAAMIFFCLMEVIGGALMRREIDLRL